MKDLYDSGVLHEKLHVRLLDVFLEDCIDRWDRISHASHQGIEIEALCDRIIVKGINRKRALNSRKGCLLWI